MKKFKKSTISDFILGIVLTLLVLFGFFLSWGPLETLEYGVYDFTTGLRVKPALAPVSVIAIDEQSITKMYNITSSAPTQIKELSPNVPDKLAPIVEKLLAKDVKARYQTGKALNVDLTVCLD